MHIKLSKPLLVGKVNHAAGEVVEVEESRAKALVEAKAAQPASALDAFGRTAEPESDPEPDPEKREAVVVPKTRKAVLDV